MQGLAFGITDIFEISHKRLYPIAKAMQLLEVRTFLPINAQSEAVQSNTLRTGEGGVLSIEAQEDMRILVKGSRSNVILWPANVAWVVPLAISNPPSPPESVRPPEPTALPPAPIPEERAHARGALSASKTESDSSSLSEPAVKAGQDWRLKKGKRVK